MAYHEKCEEIINTIRDNPMSTQAELCRVLKVTDKPFKRITELMAHCGKIKIERYGFTNMYKIV